MKKKGETAYNKLGLLCMPATPSPRGLASSLKYTSPRFRGRCCIRGRERERKTPNLHLLAFVPAHRHTHIYTCVHRHIHKPIFLKVPFRIEGAPELLFVRQGYVMAGNVGDRVRLRMLGLLSILWSQGHIGVKIKT